MQVCIALGNIALKIMLIGFDFFSQFFLNIRMVGDESDDPCKNMSSDVQVGKQHFVQAMGNLATS